MAGIDEASPPGYDDIRALLLGRIDFSNLIAWRRWVNSLAYAASILLWP